MTAQELRYDGQIGTNYCLGVDNSDTDGAGDGDDDNVVAVDDDNE
jgi:hypothetical protein